MRAETTQRVVGIESLIWDRFAEKQVGRAGEPIGPSGVGNCYRQEAYAQLGVLPTDERSTEKADAGTLIHLGIGALLADVPGVDTEVPVHIAGLSRPGVADIVVWHEGRLVDIKTYGDRAYGYRVDAGGPYPHQWHQLQLYGLGLAEVDGRDDWTIEILAINRDTGAHTVWSQPFDRPLAESLAGIIEERQAAIDEAKAKVVDPMVDGVLLAESFPREGSGPGRGMPCDYCPFMSQCWPVPFDDLSPQSATVVDDPQQVEQWAARYREASALAKQWTDEKYAAMEFLRGIVGSFGDWQVAQRAGGQDMDVPDVDAMVETFTQLGLPVPTLVKPGRKGFPVVTRKR
jgi:PD-(D/E)XK nuclease superfamily